MSLRPRAAPLTPRATNKAYHLCHYGQGRRRSRPVRPTGARLRRDRRSGAGQHAAAPPPLPDKTAFATGLDGAPLLPAARCLVLKQMQCSLLGLETDAVNTACLVLKQMRHMPPSPCLTAVDAGARPCVPLSPAHAVTRTRRRPRLCAYSPSSAHAVTRTCRHCVARPRRHCVTRPRRQQPVPPGVRIRRRMPRCSPRGQHIADKTLPSRTCRDAAPGPAGRGKPAPLWVFGRPRFAAPPRYTQIRDLIRIFSVPCDLALLSCLSRACPFKGVTWGCAAASPVCDGRCLAEESEFKLRISTVGGVRRPVPRRDGSV